MMEPPSEKKGSDVEVCYWCGSTFQREVRQRRPVCPRCYRLLTGAGIKEAEIFGPEKESVPEGGEEKAADD